MNHGTTNQIKLNDILRQRRPLTKSMIEAAGLLKDKKIDALRYQKHIRKEWGARLKRQIKLALKNTK